MNYAITSFGPKGWDDYAREGLESFCEYWPGKILAYVEHKAPDFEHPNVEFINLFDDKELVDVLAWAKENPVLQGQIPGGYSYNFDLYKFCRKVFALSDAALKHQGAVYWLDADVRFTARVPEELPMQALKGNYCGVLERKGLHIEGGIVGIDTTKDINSVFMKNYRDLYVSGDILSLRGWHDCWAFMSVCNTLKPQCINWSPGVGGIHRAFDKSLWGAFGCHLKGMRKFKKDAE